jgi:hypothetical protein
MEVVSGSTPVGAEPLTGSLPTAQPHSVLSALLEPDEHSLQAVAADAGLAVPASQVLQLVAPSVLLYVPATQSVHAPPVPSLYLPATQAWQSAALVALGSLVDVPAGHSSQSEVLASEELKLPIGQPTISR